MNVQYVKRWVGIGLASFLIGLSGCESAPTPRLSTVLELQATEIINVSQQSSTWSNIQSLGIATLSDATGPEAAPPLSSEFLSRLALRVKAKIEEQCSVLNVQTLSVSGREHDVDGAMLLKQAKLSGVNFVLIALFSSTEVRQPATFGEARMMTQIPGTITDNSALVELALVDVGKGMIVHQAHGTATESMDRLNVPIGDDQLTLEEALDILRANAGQQALDEALLKLTKSCRSAGQE